MVEKFSIYGENIGCRLSEIFIVKVLFYTRVHYKCETFRAMHTNHVKTTWWATRYLDRNSDSFRIESFVIWKTRSLFHRVNFIWLCNNINYVLRVQKCTISKKKIRKFIIFIIYRRLISTMFRIVFRREIIETSLSFLSSRQLKEGIIVR